MLKMTKGHSINKANGRKYCLMFNCVELQGEMWLFAWRTMKKPEQNGDGNKYKPPSHIIHWVMI